MTLEINFQCTNPLESRSILTDLADSVDADKEAIRTQIHVSQPTELSIQKSIACLSEACVNGQLTLSLEDVNSISILLPLLPSNNLLTANVLFRGLVAIATSAPCFQKQGDKLIIPLIDQIKTYINGIEPDKYRLIADMRYEALVRQKLLSPSNSRTETCWNIATRALTTANSILEQIEFTNEYRNSPQRIVGGVYV